MAEGIWDGEWLVTNDLKGMVNGCFLEGGRGKVGKGEEEFVAGDLCPSLHAAWGLQLAFNFEVEGLNGI